jgi:hypothetical protein
MAPPNNARNRTVQQSECLDILLDMQQPSPVRSIADRLYQLPAFMWLHPVKGRIALHVFRKRRSVQKTAVRATCASSVDLREDDLLVSEQQNGKTPPGSPGHHQIPREPVMGIEPMTPVLPRLCATAAPHGQACRCSVGSEGFEPPKSSDN